MSQRIRGLDELRGLAILIVMVGHYFGRLTAPLPDDGIRLQPANPGSIVAGWYTPEERGPVPLSGNLLLHGWAFDTSGAGSTPSGVEKVDVYVDGAHVGTATLGIGTWDVAAAFGERGNTAGWQLMWPISGAPGEHRISQVVTTRTGSYEAAVRRFRLAPSFNGWPFPAVGVDLFFVISGFLIATILVRTRDVQWTLPIFYARRALRILPLAWIVIALAAYLSGQGLAHLWAYLLFVNNWDAWPILYLGPMWSLAIEEQFYLVFPLLVLLTPPRWLWLPVSGLLLTFWSIHLMFPEVRDDLLYWSYDWRTYSRASMIVAGAWMALCQLGMVPRPRWLLAGFLGATALLLGMGGRIGHIEPFVLPTMVLLVYLAVTGKFVVDVPLLRFIGVRCYGLYLLHLFVLQAMIATFAPLPVLLDIAVYLGATLLLADLSWRFLERPLLKLAPGYRARRDEPAAAPVQAAASPVETAASSARHAGTVAAVDPA